MTDRIRRLEELLARCLAPEAPAFRRRLKGLRRALREDSVTEPAIASLERDLGRSAQRRALRAAAVPSVGFPDDLPVARAREVIAQAIQRSQVVVVSGDTGSGKTTQLPKICLAVGRGVDGMITLTQPRRIAARSVAARIAAELGTPLGQTVGFKVRFDDRTSARSLVRVVTDGVLLAEIERDPLLRRSETIIIDEAHERSLNVDFLLGYMKRLLPRRPDLKLIIASATIDVQRFSAHFANAPIVEVGGRMHPIELRYRPAERTEELPEPGVVDQALRGIEECLDSGPGDLLVFLPGERDIMDTAEALARMPTATGCEVLPLFARLSGSDQDRVFQSGRARRIVLATNVAETSVTVPGIRFVVDTGLARIARWSGRARVLRLPVEPVSRASADQRKGRCGRIGPGVCIRLYSEEEYLAREPFTSPELLRTNLASVILQMKALGLGPIEEFPFLDAPSPRLIAEGIETLTELGAVDRRGGLTPLGQRMAGLPVDPRLARIVLAATEEGVLAEALVIAAALSIQDPRERPAGQQDAADFAHAALRDPESDFLTLLRIWRRWRAESAALGSGALRRWCRTNFLSQQRLREWVDLHEQLRGMVQERLGATPASLAEESDPARVHRAVLAGFVSQIGLRTEEGEYRMPGGGRFHLFPGSSLARRTPTWVVAAEVVQTSRRFGRTLARVQGDWIEQIAPHLVHRVRSEPHWVATTGQVAAWERLTYGELVLVARRRVPYGPIAPAEARDIFIQSALVEGDCTLVAPFVEHNRALQQRVEAMEAKRRERGLMADSQALFAFFDARIPAHVHSLPSFERWRREAQVRDARLLFMRESDLLSAAPDADLALRFPDQWVLSDETSAALRYEHEPGAPNDGVHARIELADLHAADAERAEWMVPGMLVEKIEALIRALPKRLRTRFFPVREYAQGAAETLPFGRGSLCACLAEHLSRLSGTIVGTDDFDLAALPTHLRMHFTIVDEQGATLAAGQDLRALRAALAGRASALRVAAHEAAFGDAWRRTGLRSFDLSELPRRLEQRVGARVIVAFPALVDAGESAVLALLPDSEAAERATRGGLRLLFAIAARDAIAHHMEFLPGLQELSMTWIAATGRSRAALLGQMALLAAGRAFVDGFEVVRTPAEFEARLEEQGVALWDALNDVQRAAAALYGRAVEVRQALDAPAPASWGATLIDVRTQLDRLAAPDALTRTPWTELPSLARYVQALSLRLRKLSGAGIARDRANQELVARWEDELVRTEAQLAAEGRDGAILDPFRRLVEEYRVSLFAQELRTPVPVSAERLERAWRERLPEVPDGPSPRAR